MLKIENTETFGWESAIRGMRNPMNSWDKSDSDFSGTVPVIGKKDLKLMKNLSRAGDSDSKYLRMIYITCDITAPVFWLNELQTYKVGTTCNSTSLQHKGMSRDFVLSDFSYEADVETMDTMMRLTVAWLNDLKKRYKETCNYKYFRAMRQLMPMGYNYKITWSANYQVLKNIYRQRRHHKLVEWHEFCDWIEELPYSEIITGE